MTAVVIAANSSASAEPESGSCPESAAGSTCASAAITGTCGIAIEGGLDADPVVACPGAGSRCTQKNAANASNNMASKRERIRFSPGFVPWKLMRIDVTTPSLRKHSAVPMDSRFVCNKINHAGCHSGILAKGITTEASSCKDVASGRLVERVSGIGFTSHSAIENPRRKRLQPRCS